jgi:hypothetical protein
MITSFMRAYAVEASEISMRVLLRRGAFLFGTCFSEAFVSSSSLSYSSSLEGDFFELMMFILDYILNFGCIKLLKYNHE